MKHCRIVVSTYRDNRAPNAKWSLRIPVSYGTGFVLLRDKLGVCTSNHPLVTMTSRDASASSEHHVVITGPWEILRHMDTNASSAITIDGSQNNYTLYKGMVMFWLCTKSGVKWVHPYWATNSPRQYPLPSHLIDWFDSVGRDVPWMAVFASGPANTNEDGVFRKTGSATTKWSALTEPPEDVSVVGVESYFQPSQSIVLYDNGVVAPLAPPAVAATAAPVVIAAASAVTAADLSAVEARLIAIQAVLRTVISEVAMRPTRAEVELSSARSMSNLQTINENVMAVGDDAVINRSSSVKRIGELLVTSAISNLLVK